MNSFKNRVTEYVIRKKAEKVSRRLSQPMRFPAKSSVVSKVLVILPRNLSGLDNASNFVESLRHTYPGWRVELFDVDKLTRDDLNRMQLPKNEILEKLRKSGYHFVVDLNESLDQLAAYITLMTEAPYRLHLHTAGTSFFYNIVYQPQQNGDHHANYQSLLDYLGKLFVRN